MPNNPTSNVDPLGLCDPDSGDCPGGSGGCDPSDPSCGGPCVPGVDNCTSTLGCGLGTVCSGPVPGGGVSVGNGPPPVGPGGIGILGMGMGSGPLSGDYGVGLPPPGMPGIPDGFQSSAGVIDSPWVFQVTAWGWPWIVGGATACIGSGVCGAVAGGVVVGAAAAGTGYLVYTLFAKGAQGDVGHDYVRQEARELARKLGISYCDALDMIYKTARAAGNSKKANDTKATQKQDGCRGH